MKGGIKGTCVYVCCKRSRLEGVVEKGGWWLVDRWLVCKYGEERERVKREGERENGEWVSEQVASEQQSNSRE